MTELPAQDRLEQAARAEAERKRIGEETPEPSLGARLGQVGVLGWMICAPMLIALYIGRRLDHLLGSGIFYSAALLMVGAALGLWSAWKWMHRRL